MSRQPAEGSRDQIESLVELQPAHAEQNGLAGPEASASAASRAE